MADRIRIARAGVDTRHCIGGERIAAGVVAGTVWVNCFFVRDLAAPFGGAGISGIGREGGRWSFDFFCDVKNVAIRRGSFGGGPVGEQPVGEISSAAVVGHVPVAAARVVRRGHGGSRGALRRRCGG